MGEVGSQEFKKIRYWHKFAKKELVTVWNETRPTDCTVGAYEGT